jgi:ABC-type sugar transport system permease subunit
MASPLDPAPSGVKQTPMAAANVQGKELSRPAEAERVRGANTNSWQRLRNFGRSSEVKTGLLFLPPALLVFTLFVTWPVVEAAYYSFFNWNGYGSPSKWVGLDNFLRVWNEYLLPLVMINDQALYPWPLGIMQYQGEYGTDWGKVLAFVSLTLTPAVIFYLMAQKHIIAGLTSGAVKG